VLAGEGERVNGEKSREEQERFTPVIQRETLNVSATFDVAVRRCALESLRLLLC